MEIVHSNAEPLWIQASSDLIHWQVLTNLSGGTGTEFVTLLSPFRRSSTYLRTLRWDNSVPAPLDTNDIFAPYLNRVPPIVETLSQGIDEGILITRFRFESLESNRDGTPHPCQIYAILAKPAYQHGRLPGILLCHGGGQTADLAPVAGWAKLGYVALACDAPPYFFQSKSLSITHIDDPAGYLNIYRIHPTLYASTMFDSVAANLGAFNLLESDPQVDTNRIGISGVSWGGYMACMLGGLLDTRVKAVFSLYGSGFFQEDAEPGESLDDMSVADRMLWLQTFDAGARIGRARANFLFYSAADDFFFRPPSVMATYNAIRSRRALCFSPNDSHSFSLEGGTPAHDNLTLTEAEPAFFSLALSEPDKLLPQIVVENGSSRHPAFWPNNPMPHTVSWAYYTHDIDQPWTKKTWKLAPLEIESGKALPVFPDQEGAFEWFAGISFDLNSAGVTRRMSLSSVIYRSQ